MSQPETVAPLAADERLTWNEIKRRHPDQWVVLVDTDWPDAGELRSARVYLHGRDMRALVPQQKHLPSAAILWTGKAISPTLWALQHVVRAV